MSRSFSWCAALAVALFLLVSSVVVTAGAAAAAPPASAGPVIAEVAAGVEPQGVAARHGITPTHVYREVMSGFAATVTARQLASLRADRSVVAVSSDVVVARRGPRETPPVGAQPYPVPGQFAQYVTPEIRRIGGLESPTADIDGVDDRRVDADIAILDGGVDPYHPDLNVAGGVNCVHGQTGPGWQDRDGHGTLAAGFAAAIDNQIGVVGSAPAARIWAVRVADPSGLVSDSALLCGLEWVRKSAAWIEVANLSFAGTGNAMGPCRAAGITSRGGGPTRDRIHQAICSAVDRGVTVVAAAGNDAADASAYTPGAYPEVIAVSAIADFDGAPGGGTPNPPECHFSETDDHFATFSNFGAPVDIAAPGVCVLSTLPGGQYGYVEGTSFAAPLVAGAAALLRARDPGLAPAAVRSRLLAAATPGPIPGDPDAYPEGVLNISTF